MSTLQNFKGKRTNQLKELLDQIYNELYAIEQVKGFESPDMWKPASLSEYLLDALRSHFMRTTYSIDWDESSDMFKWLRSLEFGPPKPPPAPVHKPIANTFKFADVVSQHTVYDANFNIVRYQDGQGNWIERRADGDYVISA